MRFTCGRFKIERLVIVLLLVFIVQNSLSVYNLQSLGIENSPLLNIQYSISNFGFAPYGKTIIARLMMAPNFSTECNVENNNLANYENSFLLIPRGQCEFVTKALNAQRLGAQMAIIMDDKQHEKLVVMTDNGYGYKVNIPSIFINYKDGDLLKQLVQDNPDSSVMMKITFQNHKTEKVDVTFWLQANNRQSYKLVSDFRKYYNLIEDNINFKLVYSNIECGDLCNQDDCYFNKNYCALNLIHEESASGTLILDQQIREEIVFDEYPKNWWKYMKYIENQCSVITELKQCGEKAMKSHEIDPVVVQKQFTGSFSSKDNTYLKKNQKLLTGAGINRFPTVTLNSVKVKGSLNGEFIFDDICNTLSTPPTSCKKYVQGSTEFEERVSNEWATLLLVIVSGVVIFCIIFIIYRRHMKKKISFEMQSRVDDMVSKYIEFYSERSKK